MIYEIRNYYYDPVKFETYAQWARKKAVPILKANFDVVGLWVNNGEPPEIWGNDIESRKHGPPNLTWVIRWESMEQRNLGHKVFSENQEWQEIWSTHPDANGYLHCEVTFGEEA